MVASRKSLCANRVALRELEREEVWRTSTLTLAEQHAHVIRIPSRLRANPSGKTLVRPVVEVEVRA